MRHLQPFVNLWETDFSSVARALAETILDSFMVDILVESILLMMSLPKYEVVARKEFLLRQSICAS